MTPRKNRHKLNINESLSNELKKELSNTYDQKKDKMNTKIRKLILSHKTPILEKL